MAVCSVKPLVGSDNVDIKPTIGSSFMEHHLGFPPDTSLFARFPKDLLENTNVKIETGEFDSVVPESQPCMTVDGTGAPPCLFYSSFYYSAGQMAISPSDSLSTTQGKFFHTRMSTGGRAPPKL